MIGIKEATVLYRPTLALYKRGGFHFFLDPDGPNWVATNRAGAEVLKELSNPRSLNDLIRVYANRTHRDLAQAWLQVRSFIQEAMRHELVSTQPILRETYRGRAFHLKPRLQEFWIHTNNSCNLTCSHCLVESHPGDEPGLPTEFLKRVIDEATELGAYLFYFTGGESFVRKDIFELIDYVNREKKAELIILTNATLFHDHRLEALKRMDRQRLKLQVSLDGSCPEINDPIRGEGTFRQITEGLKTVSDLGFDASLTAVVTAENIRDLVRVPNLAKELGAKSLHLMWLHRRGRILEGSSPDPFPPIEQLLELAREVKRHCKALGVLFDNHDSLKLRVDGPPGLKYDLGNACWESLCLYADGHLYPSASFAGYPPLDMGNALEEGIQKLWLSSPVACEIRNATLLSKTGLDQDPFRFLTGGGDIEHSYFYAEARTGKGDFAGEDPYYPLYRELILDVMEELALEDQQWLDRHLDPEAPLIYHAMGRGGLVCGSQGPDAQVSTLHSNCVLSFDVEKPYKMLQEFYGKAAEKPQAELCCPTSASYTSDEVSHIPQEVLDRFYGCGSPLALAGVKTGEVVVDLGSGGGIDCFIAAKKVGPGGKVIGVDMTDQMLSVARRNKIAVAQNLGYDVVEFRKGYLERIPVEDQACDLITSNCVINLSPNKKSVFREMNRILKDHGRIVLADIVSERPVPPHIRLNEQLWGECISGALTEDEFLVYLEQAGFYGLEVLKKSHWKNVEGYDFYSVTVRGYKKARAGSITGNGYQAIYRGPFKAVMDEEGRLFPRNEAVGIPAEIAQRLKRPPYVGVFTVLEPVSERGLKFIQITSPPIGSETEQACCPTEGQTGPSCC